MKSSGSSQFFLAGRQISAWQNGWALAGDYLSAAAFLGSIAMYFSQGMDSLFYAVATLVGWPLLLILFADKLRRSGAYTISGVLNQRFHSTRLQILSGSTSLLISLFYLLVQLMGAGTLLKLLFNLSYTHSLMLVVCLTAGLVFMGGMKATTLVQSSKAMILFGFAGTMLFLVWREMGYSIPNLWARARELGDSSGFMPSVKIAGGVEQASLVLGLLLGLLGLPHVLMRFFTVKKPRTAVLSAIFASFLIALFFVMNLIVGFGAYVIFYGETLTGGANMALMHLADFLGGDLFTYLFAIVVFVTILAVMAGLVMAMGANITQDLLPLIAPEFKENPLVARASLGVMLLLSAFLAYLFEGVNLAFLFGIAFSWAASAHFPLLFGAFYIKSFNERAAFYTLLVGALGSTLFLITSRTIWCNIFGFSEPLHPYLSPTLFVLPLALIALFMGAEKKRGKRELNDTGM